MIATAEKVEKTENKATDKQLYIVIDNSLSNIIEACIVGVMDMDNVINYLKENLEDDFEDKCKDIDISLQTIDYNIPLFIEIPDSDDFIEIIKVRKYF